MKSSQSSLKKPSHKIGLVADDVALNRSSSDLHWSDDGAIARTSSEENLCGCVRANRCRNSVRKH